MSRFLSQAAKQLEPYIPGEQPQNLQYLKLNTNESPYDPSPLVTAAINDVQSNRLRLYPDPTVADLTNEIANYKGLPGSQVFVGAGSDEVLGYAYMAFFDSGDHICSPDISYGFYPVYARLCGLEDIKVPLDIDFRIHLADYKQFQGHVILANPNAPTGLVLPQKVIEQFLKENPDRLLIVDEAYIDFSQGDSCVLLVKCYDNLLVIQTFSKSRSLAGMRIGCAFGQEPLIQSLMRIKFSFNPYNLNCISIAAGIASIKDQAYFEQHVQKIIETRLWTKLALEQLGFTVLDSGANFLFTNHPNHEGQALYRKLKEKSVLVRHFNKERIHPFIRITIGSEEEMQRFVTILEEIL